MAGLYRPTEPTPKSKRRTVKPELTPEQQQEVKEAFELFDTDKDGVSRIRWSR